MGKGDLLVMSNEKVILGNDEGCKLIFEKDALGYGMAEVYRQGLKIAELDLLKTRRYATTSKLPPYYHVGPFCHRVPQANIDFQSEEKCTVSFSGESAYYYINVNVSVYAGKSACDIRYEVKAIHPFADVTETPYVQLRFCPKNSELAFTQYPLHAPITAEFDGRMDIKPQKDCVPYLLGMRTSDEKKFAFGVGYHLEQEFEKGRLCYESTTEGGVFDIYPTDSIEINGVSSKFHIIFSMGDSQGECIAAFRELCGYEMKTPFYRTAEESEELFMSVFRNCSAYIDGKGYRQQIHLSTGEPAKGDVAEGAYGKFIPICSNVSVAHNLYRWWLQHPEDDWARDRAFEMIDFFMQSQAEHGGVPNLYLDGEDRYITYVEYVRECRIREGRTEHPYPDGVCKYTTHMMSMAAYFLYRFYLLRKEYEGNDCTQWRDSALRAMDYLAGNVTEDGMVGRNYTDEGEWDDICADVWLLIALDYFHDQTGNEFYANARDRMEGWVNRTFADINHWYNWSADGGFWHGEGMPPINHDAFEMPTYATYCAYRYLRTKDVKYLQRVRDTYEFLWLCMIPTQYPDYKHLTRGLIKEQDTYSTYDVPFNTTRLIDCLPYLTALTNDSFYMEFYKFVLQLQMAYQAVETKFPAFYIGLDWIEKDVLGEGDVAYISEFAGSIFLDSINSPYCCRYIGGKELNLGLDYTPEFSPELAGSGIHTVYSTCRVDRCAWNEKDKTLRIKFAGIPGKEYRVGVKLEADIVLPKQIVLENGTDCRDIMSLYDSRENVLETTFILSKEQELGLKKQ